MKKFIISMIAAFALVGAFSTATAHAGAECRPTSFTADDYSIDAGDVAVLHWDSTSGCVYARIDPADYPDQRPPADTIPTLPLYHTTYFTLTVYSDIEETQIGGQLFLTITVDGDENDDDDNDSSCRINSFDADDTSIEEGDETTLEWETTGCDEVRINQGIGEVDLDGSEDVDPDEDTTYTLSAYDNGHLEDTDTVRITVDEEESCSIDSFTASDTSIESGDSVELRWRTTGVDDIDLSPGSGNYDEDDEVTVRPTRTTTYTLDANCRSGSDKSRSITIRVSEEDSAPQAITTVATVLSSTSAQLNGIAIPNTNSGSTRAWFEWGPSASLGYRTNEQSVPSTLNQSYYNAPVSGLVPGTWYFYRAVVQNQNGTAYGDTVRFQTRTATVTPPTTTVVKTHTVSSVVAQSAPSLLELRVESAYDRMCVDGTIDYTVTYRNISGQTLKDAVLQVSHQKEITFISSSRGDYDVVDREITVDLGLIAPGETGTVLIRGRVNSQAVNGNLTVLTAQVVYTNSQTKAQENAIAYSLVTISDDCPNILGASAFGFGHFLPDTLLEWLLLILVILGLIVVGRQLSKKPPQKPAA